MKGVLNEDILHCSNVVFYADSKSEACFLRSPIILSYKNSVLDSP